MNRTCRFISLTMLLLSLAACASAPRTVDPRTLTFAPLDFTIPRSERTTLGNGITLYMLEDHELPLVNMTAYINVGSIYEPAELTGLAGITGAVLRSGGTTSLSPEQLDAELEFMASGIESGIGEDSGSLTMYTLGKNLDRTLELYADVLLRPAFSEARVELAKKNTREAIRRQNDDPKAIAGREIRKALYEGHPLGREATMESVGRISRDDLVGFYQRFYRPQGMILAVSGDFKQAEMKAKLEKLLGGWHPAEEKVPQVSIPDTTPKKQVLLARKQVSQSVIRMGHPGLEKNNPDQYAVRVMDYILGGGFTSRLTQEIRSNLGLAYHAGSRFDIGRRFPGTFIAETETKSASTAKVIGLMQGIIADLTRTPVSAEELQQAKDSIINSFIFGFARADYVVNQQARLEYYGFPEGYLENFRANIAKVSRDDVLRVGRTYLHPDSLTVVVVGDDSKFDQPLAAFGPVREIPLETAK
ncbi:MAG TPA: pitrilysin family protein [Geobacteraceae bacterium]|nr:pitrilysin family protein [Geobacteraceae bacterium]